MDQQQHIQHILKEYWGFDSLRGIQQEVITAVMAGKDVLAIMPTGGGKSLCFQVPALMRDGLCLVVSPLIALMQDQVSHLKQRGIPAAALHSGLGSTEIVRLYDDLQAGLYRFLYVSPERLDSIGFLRCIRHIQVQLLVVDEAHCIAEWGYDFRPAYLNIGKVRKELNHVACLALTASATPAVQKDILQQLDFKDPEICCQDFARPKLSYTVHACVDENEKQETLFGYLGRHEGQSTLIYARSRRVTEQLAALLSAEGYPAGYYHAGLEHDQRESVSKQWLENNPAIMVATSAFGMGIDKPDVRLVVHYGPTDNLESYYQQAGRAGRDMQAASAVLLYTPADLQQQQNLPALLYPPFATIQQFYQHLADYLKLPVGLGEDRFFSFMIADFALKFKWNPLQVHSILKNLEQSGLITYLEQVYLPSKLKITASRAEVAAYVEGVKEPAEVLDYLMRHYEHIFMEAVTIRESQIAWQLYLDEARLRKILFGLNQAGFIRYMPARNLPQIHFLTGRAPASSLVFDHERYEKRKKWFEWRLEMLLRYIQQTSKCRPQMLAAYFGQTLAKPCGICDNCKAATTPKT
ncbi:RecQ family ATP-dependent DNA helicase [Arachidicoccus ginsenosidivorans]|uniref:ATP-dependent DNA helicase RecQ n=1 Tax=Arachidicoccus ginsenosidivorans TaxID=496057 RepID=A0A5B8VJK1_9BACT|nr:ATP-dependent DNA helicase RecQ [Arachidicoccus ginsenosidivorans]QEC71142.1 RecQ family ATP-dependent DNA helicase [Arachidicoccus ginsenosidivorans]